MSKCDFNKVSEHLFLKYVNADLKISLYVCVHIKMIPLKCRILILRIIELFRRRVCKMFVYKHTEAVEYVKKWPSF